MLKNLLLLPAAALVAFGMVACDGDDDDTATTNTPDGSAQTTTPSGNGTPSNGETPGSDDQVEVELDALGTSGVAGMAALMQAQGGSGTAITVTLADGSATGNAEIRTGSCDDWGTDVVATIGSVTAGAATGSVDLTLDEIESEDHVLVVMPAIGGDPISCGEI